MRFIIKILLIFSFIIKNRKEFKFNIPNSKLVLVDNITVSLLSNAILNKFNFVQISTRIFSKKEDRNNVENYFFINPKLILFFILGLLKKLNFKNSYVFACIKSINPKIVLHNTHDHNLIFIANLLPKVDFIMLCHGQWCEYNDSGRILESTTFPYELAKTKVKNLNNFYIFLRGEKDIKIFNKIGVNKHNDKIKMEAIGSYEASYYSSCNFSKEKKHDILFVSQLYDNFLDQNDELSKLFVKDTAIAIKLLLDYSIKNDLTLTYLCRNNKANDYREINFIKSITKSNQKLQIIQNEAAVWREVYASDIIATIDSSVGFDAISINKKTLLMPLNSTYTKTYTVDENSYLNNVWDWSIVKEDYTSFQIVLDDLMQINQTKYEETIKDKVDYWFNNDKKLPAHKFVQDFITKKII